MISNILRKNTTPYWTSGIRITDSSLVSASIPNDQIGELIGRDEDPEGQEKLHRRPVIKG